MKIKSEKDFFSGLLFVGFGVAFARGSFSYQLGVASLMGPGYFPLMLGILLTVLGIVIMLKAVVMKTDDGERVGPWAWKPLAYILGANLAFGALLTGLPSIKLPAMGVITGIYVLTVIASLANHWFKIREVLILATILALGSYLAFIALLKLQIPMWPAFITG
jgi:hypothetical protein